MTYFDHEKYLVEAAESVAKVDYPNVELIVVDDCSPATHAEQVLAGCSVKNIQFIRHEQNRGHIASKNTGIKSAKGELILPLDSDDLIMPKYLEETVPLFKNREIGVVLTDVELIGDQKSVYTPALTKEDFVNLMTPSNTFVVRRELFTNLGLYDETLRYGDETDFLLRVLESGWKIGHVSFPLYLYRKHENGLSLSVSYVKLLSDMIDRHPQTFVDNMKEALLYRERRYWGEIENAKLSGGTSVSGTEQVTVRQYQHLHTEFHKLLRHYEDLQSEFQRLQTQCHELSSGKLFRFREMLTKLISGIKR